MRKDYLSLDGSVQPIEIGDGYKDYLLSDLVEAKGTFLLFCRFVDKNTLQTFVGFHGGPSFAPVENCGKVIGIYTNVRIRFQEGFEPRWVSVFSNGREYFPNDLLMEKNYLYPGDSVKRIEIGEVYRDYMLSDVLAYSGISLISGRMHYGREKTEHIDGHPKSKDYCFALVDTDRGKFILAPISCFKPRVIEDFPPAPFPNIWPGHEFVDLRVRYYIKGKEVLRPVWYSAKCKSGEELVKGEDGQWHHVPKYEERYSIFARCPYCTTLITGPLFEFPEMPLEYDGYLRYVHSDYLEILE